MKKKKKRRRRNPSAPPGMMREAAFAITTGTISGIITAAILRWIGW